MARICSEHSAICSAVAARSDGDHDGTLDPVGKPTHHSSTRMPPIEPPTTAAHRVDPEVIGQQRFDRDLVANGDDGESRPVALAVRAASEAGPVVPWQPPSTFGHTTKNRSVSMGAPGPMSPCHHPAARVAGPGRSGRVGVAGQRMEDEHGIAVVAVELAPGLVGHVDRAQTSTGLEVQPFDADHTGERRSPGVVPGTPGSGYVARRVTRPWRHGNRRRGRPGCRRSISMPHAQPDQIGRDAGA